MSEEAKRDELKRIASLALVLTTLGPENEIELQRLKSELEGYQLTHDKNVQCDEVDKRIHNLIDDVRHDIKCYERQRGEVREMLLELTKLVYRNLDIGIQHTDAIEIDWSLTVAELHRIKNVARRELLRQDRVGIPDFVTLSQCAGMVNKSKRQLERWKTKDTDFPTPEVIGEDGGADEWKWTTIRPYLERKANRELPETFPAHVTD